MVEEEGRGRFALRYKKPTTAPSNLQSTISLSQLSFCILRQLERFLTQLKISIMFIRVSSLLAFALALAFASALRLDSEVPESRPRMVQGR